MALRDGCWVIVKFVQWGGGGLRRCEDILGKGIGRGYW